MDDFKQNAVKSIKWTGLYSVVNAVSGPLYRMILATLLFPKDFAYIAVVSLFTGISQTIGNLGMGEAIIQKDKVKPEQISTLLYFNTLLFSLISVLLTFFAESIASFYDFKGLGVLLKLTGVTIVLNGITIVFRVYLQRQMLFKEFSLINIARIMIDIGSSIVLIKLGLGVVGFVWGTILATVTYTFLMIITVLKKTDISFVPVFQLTELKSLLGFGLPISLKQLFTYITQRVDEIIIGKFLAPEVLGIYFFGKDLMQKSQILVTHAISQMTLPFFSRLKNDLPNLAGFYSKMSFYIAVIAFPLFFGMAVAAELFVPLFFGAKWSASIEIIRAFAVMGIFTVLTANFATNLLYSLDKTKTVLWIDLITGFSYLLALLIFTGNGLSFVIATYILFTIIKTLTLQFFVGKQLNKCFWEYFHNLRTPFLAASTMLIVLIFLQISLFKIDAIILLPLELLMGILVFGFFLYAIDKQRLLKTISLITHHK